jgi:hypothetical protein
MVCPAVSTHPKPGIPKNKPAATLQSPATHHELSSRKYVVHYALGFKSSAFMTENHSAALDCRIEFELDDVVREFPRDPSLKFEL